MYTVKRTRKTTIVIDYRAIAGSVHSRFLVQRERLKNYILPLHAEKIMLVKPVDEMT